MYNLKLIGVDKNISVIVQISDEEIIKTKLLSKAISIYSHNSVLLRNSHYKTISAIRGSTAKIRPQKFTGRARQGAARELHMRGGSVKFGYSGNKTKDLTKRYKKYLKMNKKERRASLIALIKNRLYCNKIILMSDDLISNFEKTKEADILIKEIRSDYNLNSKISVVLNKSKDNYKTIKNLHNLNIYNQLNINTFLLAKDEAWLCEQTAFTSILERLEIKYILNENQ